MALATVLPSGKNRQHSFVFLATTQQCQPNFQPQVGRINSSQQKFPKTQRAQLLLMFTGRGIKRANKTGRLFNHGLHVLNRFTDFWIAIQSCKPAGPQSIPISFIIHPMSKMLHPLSSPISRTLHRQSSPIHVLPSRKKALCCPVCSILGNGSTQVPCRCSHMCV